MQKSERNAPNLQKNIFVYKIFVLKPHFFQFFRVDFVRRRVAHSSIYGARFFVRMSTENPAARFAELTVALMPTVDEVYFDCTILDQVSRLRHGVVPHPLGRRLCETCSTYVALFAKEKDDVPSFCVHCKPNDYIVAKTRSSSYWSFPDRPQFVVLMGEGTCLNGVSARVLDAKFVSSCGDHFDVLPSQVVHLHSPSVNFKAFSVGLELRSRASRQSLTGIHWRARKPMYFEVTLEVTVLKGGEVYTASRTLKSIAPVVVRSRPGKSTPCEPGVVGNEAVHEALRCHIRRLEDTIERLESRPF